MKILVIGGTGFIGGGAAVRLAELGHDVTIGARRAPAPGTALDRFPVLIGDYVEQTYRNEDLAQFDAVVFTAGNDAKQRAEGEDEAEHLERANVIGLPRFFAQLRDSGVRRAVYVGSFYPQAIPEAIERSVYVRSRDLADKGIRALASKSFHVCSVNPPYILGWIDGQDNWWLRTHAEYALGKTTDEPLWAIPGGVNFMSLDSLCDAIVGALENGENGKAYLVGDANLSYRDYLQAFRDGAGLEGEIAVRDEPHPVLLDWALYAGRGNFAFYEPDPAEVAQLGYRRDSIADGVAQVLRGIGVPPRT